MFDFITLTNGVAPFKPTPFFGFGGPERDRERALVWLQSKNLNFSLPNSQTYATLPAYLLPVAVAVAVAGASLCSILFGLARKAHKSCSVVYSLLFVPPTAALLYAIHPFISFVKIE